MPGGPFRVSVGGMLILSLTSIPPRFAMLAPTLDSLLAQGIGQVVLSLPRAYRRFAGAVTAPPLPPGVTLHWTESDYGPATKLLGPAHFFKGRGARVLYCDDDVIYGAGWARTLLEAHDPNTVTAASAFSPARLRRSGPGLIAQGFSGVVVEADHIDRPMFKIPDAARYVDDVWLSGHFARLGLPVRLCTDARPLCTPRDLGHDLQLAAPTGLSRAESNTACADLIHQRYGVWPPM